MSACCGQGRRRFQCGKASGGAWRPGSGDSAGEDNPFLILASTLLEKLKLLCEEDKEYSNPLNQQLSKQAIWTYFVENKLVDEDFPEDTAQKELIHFLSEPEILKKIMSIQNIVISLGINSWNVSLGDEELYPTCIVIL